MSQNVLWTLENVNLVALYQDRCENSATSECQLCYFDRPIFHKHVQSLILVQKKKASGSGLYIPLRDT